MRVLKENRLDIIRWTLVYFTSSIGGFLMKKYVLASFLGMSLVLAACGGAADKDTATDTGVTASAEVEKHFQQSCASCHGGNLEGRSGPNLQKVGSKYSKDEIEDIIVNGQGGMPGGLLKGAEASEVADWLAQHN